MWQKDAYVWQHLYTQRAAYVGGNATKHVQLSSCSESTGIVLVPWFDLVVLTIAQCEMLRRPGKQE